LTYNVVRNSENISDEVKDLLERKLPNTIDSFGKEKLEEKSRKYRYYKLDDWVGKNF